jgi:hypothetical protein
MTRIIGVESNPPLFTYTRSQNYLNVQSTFPLRRYMYKMYPQQSSHSLLAAMHPHQSNAHHFSPQGNFALPRIPHPITSNYFPLCCTSHLTRYYPRLSGSVRISLPSLSPFHHLHVPSLTSSTKITSLATGFKDHAPSQAPCPIPRTLDLDSRSRSTFVSLTCYLLHPSEDCNQPISSHT